MSKPYFYIIQEIATGRYYAGSRTANGCHPNDLLTTYLTSSNDIRDTIQQDGVDAFKIVKIQQRSDAYDYESRFLQRVDARNNDAFINQHNNDNKWGDGDYITVKDKEGVAFRIHKDDPRWKTGKVVGINAGRKWSDETNRKKGICSYHPRHIEVEWEGVVYRSKRAFRKATGFTQKQVEWIIENGKPEKPGVMVMGEEYPTYHHARLDLGVSKKAMNRYRKTGSFSEAIPDNAQYLSMDRKIRNATVARYNGNKGGRPCIDTQQNSIV